MTSSSSEESPGPIAQALRDPWVRRASITWVVLTATGLVVFLVAALSGGISL